MDDLQAYLDSVRSEGVLDSSGVFSLDLTKAREKLAIFFGRQGEHYFHYALRFAVGQGPELVGITESAALVQLDFTAAGYSESELRGLFGGTSLGLRVLQMALVGTLEAGGETLEVSGPGGMVRFSAGGDRFSPGAPGGQRLSLARRPPKGLKAWISRGELGGLAARDFGWCLTPLAFQEKAWRPPKLACVSRWAANRTLPVPGLAWPTRAGAPVAVGIRGGPPQPATASWLNQGATILERREPSLPPNLHLVADLPIPLDLSLRKPLQDWVPPTARLTPLAASLACRALLEDSSWLAPETHLVADWVLMTLMGRGQIEMAAALATRLWESGPSLGWSTLALMERFTYLMRRLPEAPAWATHLSDRRQACLNHLELKPAGWKELARCGWPHFPECPGLTAACASLPAELAAPWCWPGCATPAAPKTAGRWTCCGCCSRRPPSTVPTPCACCCWHGSWCFSGKGPFPPRKTACIPTSAASSRCLRPRPASCGTTATRSPTGWPRSRCRSAWPRSRPPTPP